MSSITGKRTVTRYWILLLLCFMYLICFADRVTISVVAPMIQREFGFDKLTMGLIFSAFVSAYALGQIPGGWVGDRLGPRRVLPAIVAIWSFFTTLTAQAYSAGSFVAVRFLFGFSEGGAYPTATRAMQLWYPKEERGFVQGITHSFSRFGGAIVPPIAIFIMNLWGWRAVFYVFGAVGIFWSILFYVVYRNTPEEHKGVNEAELAHIRGTDSSGAARTVAGYSEKPKVRGELCCALPTCGTWFSPGFVGITPYTSSSHGCRPTLSSIVSSASATWQSTRLCRCWQA